MRCICLALEIPFSFTVSRSRFFLDRYHSSFAFGFVWFWLRHFFLYSYLHCRSFCIHKVFASAWSGHHSSPRRDSCMDWRLSGPVVPELVTGLFLCHSLLARSSLARSAFSILIDWPPVSMVMRFGTRNPSQAFSLAFSTKYREGFYSCIFSRLGLWIWRRSG